VRKCAAIVLCTVIALAGAAQTPPVVPPTFRLYFLGHDIGRETDTWSADGLHLQSAFHFDDRGTAIDLTASLDMEKGAPTRLVVKGRNYRLFASDSEVTVAGGRAHVRDLGAERDVAIEGRPFFPIDNYAPIGVQEALIKYWIANGRPKEILAPPAGVVRIESRGVIASDAGPRGGPPNRAFEQLAIDGVVWGTETAWIDRDSGRLIGLTTWAGALPFQAFCGDCLGLNPSAFFKRAIDDRIRDLRRLTEATPAVARNSFALTGARAITAASAPIDSATIVVRDGRIAAIGPSATTTVPRGMPTVDVRGKTIIPGLWDMHAHASQIDWAPVYLASGVTTIRDLGGDNGFLVAMRDAVRSGQVLGPRYVLAGLVDGPGPRAFGAVTAATPDEGRTVVRKYHADGFEQMKIYSLVAPDVVAAVVDEAHKLGMTVTGHVPGGMTSQSVVEAGFDSIAHMQLRGESGSDASKQQIAFFRTHNTVMDPTQSWNELSGRPSATPLASLFPDVARLPRPLTRMFASMSPGNGDPQATRARLVSSVRLLKDAIDAGLLVVAGTDKGVPGFSLQRELELYVEGGMTPLQALQTATIMPARAMKLDKELGTIEVGKRADLVVLDANADPLANISNIRTARMVLANGRLYDCNVLWKAAGFATRSSQ
jgi:imidazolonepropionase-like amidohydrolase